ncbi:NAD(P)-dependent oxidoreductase [Actinocorallia longicatena]|uniref:2-hydroxyacid dehydrogenase n=1 Tax=Actinocorallia longicatena TaxID=111803 RepID=A0ABP6Q5T0_9ACTN
MKIAALMPLPPDLLRHLFAGLPAELVLPATRDRAGLLAAVADAEMIVGDFTGELPLDAEVVAAAGRLRFVQQPQVGTDSLDLDALTARGVVVANTGGANVRSVAEWAVGAAFALCRRTAFADRRMREGRWLQRGIGGRELHAQRVGIVGYGAIGSTAAGLFRALGCTVSYWNRSARPDPGRLGLDELLAASDVLVVTLPLTGETRGLLGPEKLALLPPRALLVNVSRGGIVPDRAVLDALRSGALAGAALDVFETEPLPPDHPLLLEEDVLLSPHEAGVSDQAQMAIIGVVLENLASALAGRPVEHVVNGLNPIIQSETI